MRLGLFGFPVSHSYSAGIFQRLFESDGVKDGSYSLYEAREPDQILEIAEKESLDGFNITVPHKEAILDQLDDLEKSAEQVGAVNAVAKKGDEWIGYNTDVLGFQESVEEIEFNSRNALVLGTGGSSRAVKYALNRMDWNSLRVSRNPSGADIGYQEISNHEPKKISLVVNCTPLGMAPFESKFPPVDFELFGTDTLFYDLVYNPEETVFLNKARDFGYRTKNGLEMLILQARAAWDIWKK